MSCWFEIHVVTCKRIASLRCDYDWREAKNKYVIRKVELVSSLEFNVLEFNHLRLQLVKLQ